MKTTKIKLTLAGLLALVALSWGGLHLRGDLWLAIAPSGTNAQLTWSNSAASLEYSLTLTGAWTTVEGAGSPFAVPVTNDASFFRLRLHTGDPRYLAPTFTTAIGDPSGGCGCTSPENPNSLAAGSAQDNGQGSVFLHTGELTQHAVDLSIPGRGFDWKFERRYRSGMQYDGPVGQGWDFNYNQRLAVQANGDVLRVDGLGRVDRYVLTGGSYQSPSGFYTHLVRNLDGTFDERDRHGTVDSYSATNTLGIAQLTRIRDRNGNQMTFDYNASGQLTNVTDTLARNIAYAYDGNGRLTNVTDFTGRSLQFAYDGDGNLASVTSPAVTGTPNGNDFPLGKTTRYTYSSGFSDARLNHNLLTVTAPNEVAVSGPPRLVAQYDTSPASINADRVLSLTLGGTNASGVGAGGTIAYGYASFGPAGSNDFATAVFQNTVTNRNGNRAEYRFNQLGNIVRAIQFTRGLRPGEPPGFTNTFAYNRDGEMTGRTNAEGDSANYSYNTNSPDRFQQGNLLQVVHLPGPRGGDQVQIVTSQTYETNFNFVSTTTDARGTTTTFAYDGHGNRNNTVHRIPSIVEDFEYNAFGQMTAHVLPDNGSGSRRRDVMTYNSSGPQTGCLQSQVVDSGGFNLTTTYEYDSLGNPVRVVDPRGNDTLYTVNALNQIVRELSRSVDTTSGPVRYQRDWFYDGNDNLVRSDVENRDETGALAANTQFTTTFAYDILNCLSVRMEEEEVGYDVVTEFGYDPNRNLTLTRKGQAVSGADTNNVIQITCDERDLVFRVIRAPGSSVQSTTQTDYDGNGNPVRTAEGTEDAGGHVTTYACDGYDRRITSTDPMGNLRTTHYDANGNLTSSRVEGELNDLPGSAGNVRLSETTYTYDAMDRRTRSDVAFFDTPTQVPIGDGFATTMTIYSDASQVLAAIDDNNHGATNRYDTANRPAGVTDAKGNTVSYTYDANSTVVQTVAMEKSDLGNPDVTFTNTYAYDNLSRRTQTVDSAGITNQFAYDSRGNQVLHTDGRGILSRYEYDGLNRLVRTIRDMNGDGPDATEPPDILVTCGYDDSSRRTTITDDNTNTTHYVYDSLDRLIRLERADNTTNYYTYDSRDNLIQQDDAQGTIVTNTYDLLDRRTARRVTTSGAGVAGPALEQFTYDGLSRVMQANSSTTFVSRRYDSLDHLISESQQPSGAPLRTITAVFDGVGHRTQLVYPGGRTNVFTCDALNRMKSAYDFPAGPATFIASNNYVGPRRVERVDYGNTTRLDVGYDAGRRIAATTHTNVLAGTVVDARTYLWDNANNKIFVQEPAGAHNYGFDAANRLIGSIAPLSLPEIYQLDGVGNRLLVNGPVDSGPYTMNPTLPEPADFQVSQYTSTPFDARTYNRNGNLTISTSGPRSFAYDSRDQLTTVLAPALNVTCKYDPLGRRLEKTVNGVITRFYYDGNQVIEEQNAANGTVATYCYLPNDIRPGDRISAGPAVDNDDAEVVFCSLVQMQRGGQSYYYHADDLGSVERVTDQSGNVVEQYQYGDYGVPSFYNGSGGAIGGTAIGNPYLFLGMRYDSESALYEVKDPQPYQPVPSALWARIGGAFDPRAGRFISASRSSGQPRSPQAFHPEVDDEVLVWMFAAVFEPDRNGNGIQGGSALYAINESCSPISDGRRASVAPRRYPPPVFACGSPEYLSDEYFKLLSLRGGIGGNGALAAVEYLSDEYFKLLSLRGGIGGNGAPAAVEYLSDEYFKLLSLRGGIGGNGAPAAVEYLSDEYFKLLSLRGGIGGNGTLAAVEYLSDEYFKLLSAHAGNNPVPGNQPPGPLGWQYLSDEYFKF